MRLFLHELKKIWRPGILLAIIVINVMFGYVFTSHIPLASITSKDFNSDLAVLTELREEYGGELDYDEWLDAHKYWDKYFADMDEFIIGNPLYENEGIYSGADLWEFRNNYAPDGEFKTEEEAQEYYDYFHNMMNPFFGGEYEELSNYAVWKLQSLDFLMEQLVLFHEDETYLDDFINLTFTYENGEFISRTAERHSALLRNNTSDDAYKTLFPGWIVNLFYDYMELVIVIAIISVGIFVLPFVTRDRHSQMTAMQYSSKTGRKIVQVQFSAALLSALAMTLILISVYVAVFITANSDFIPFVNAKIATVIFSNILPWWNMIFMQYIALHAIMATVLTVGTAAVLFFMSLHSRDYITLLLKSLPVMTAIGFIGIVLVNEAFTAYGMMYWTLPIIGIEFIISGIVLLIGLGLCVFACKRVTKKDLL